MSLTSQVAQVFRDMLVMQKKLKLPSSREQRTLISWITVGWRSINKHCFLGTVLGVRNTKKSSILIFIIIFSFKNHIIRQKTVFSLLHC